MDRSAVSVRARVPTGAFRRTSPDFVRDAARTTVESTELASPLANVGDARTLLIHPASITHQQLTDEEKQANSVTDDLVRISVGLEDTDGIVADLDAAIDEAT